MKKKRFLLILIALILLLPAGVTFSRYVVKNIKNYIMEANNFFFNSDKLVEGGISYEINNWSGSSNVDVQFELNNHRNNILTSDTDINYTLNVSCATDMQCALNYAEGTTTIGTIQVEEKTENLTLSVTPTRVFNPGENVSITVTASSTNPYVKVLSATFIISVGRKGIDYEIVDKANQPYFMFKITNAIDEYKVYEAFGNYTVGQVITTNNYLALSAADKAKCAGARVTLSFDPNTVILDTTSDILKISTYNTTAINGVNYISSITFNMDILSSLEIRFYKKNSSANYTYPIVNNSPIVTFGAV